MAASSQRDNDGGGGRRRLQQDRGEDTNHHTSNRVGFISKERTSRTSSHDLWLQFREVPNQRGRSRGRSKPPQMPTKIQTPLLRGVHTASSANFAPGGISVFVLHIKVAMVSLLGRRHVEANPKMGHPEMDFAPKDREENVFCCAFLLV